MNDYKELIDELKELLSLNDENLQSLIIENNDLQNALANALDAIEQLTKKRDESKKNCDSCAKKTTNCITWLQEELAKIQKERDAAVADLKSVLASECGLNQCRYCKYQEDDYQLRKHLEGEIIMAHLIDADGLKKSIEEDEELKNNSLAYLLMNLMTCYIDESPTVDAEPVRHGHWVAKNPMIRRPDARNYYCSNCKDEPIECGKFCKECGAKMDGVK